MRTPIEHCCFKPMKDSERCRFLEIRASPRAGSRRRDTRAFIETPLGQTVAEVVWRWVLEGVKGGVGLFCKKGGGSLCCASTPHHAAVEYTGPFSFALVFSRQSPGERGDRQEAPVG